MHETGSAYRSHVALCRIVLNTNTCQPNGDIIYFDCICWLLLLFVNNFPSVADKSCHSGYCHMVYGIHTFLLCFGLTAVMTCLMGYASNIPKQFEHQKPYGSWALPGPTEGPLDRVADLPSRRALRSASSSRLVMPTFRLSTVGSRSFSVAGPRVWNGLPEDVVLAPSLSTFRRRLKTYLYKQSYPDLVLWLSIRHLSGPCDDNVT